MADRKSNVYFLDNQSINIYFAIISKLLPTSMLKLYIMHLQFCMSFRFPNKNLANDGSLRQQLGSREWYPCNRVYPAHFAFGLEAKNLNSHNSVDFIYLDIWKNSIDLCPIYVLVQIGVAFIFTIFWILNFDFSAFIRRRPKLCKAGVNSLLTSEPKIKKKNYYVAIGNCSYDRQL